MSASQEVTTPSAPQFDREDSPSPKPPNWWDAKPTKEEYERVQLLTLDYARLLNCDRNLDANPTRAHMLYNVTLLPGAPRLPIHNLTSHFNSVASAILSGGTAFAGVMSLGLQAALAQQQSVPRQYHRDQRPQRGDPRPQRGDPRPYGDRAPQPYDVRAQHRQQSRFQHGHDGVQDKRPVYQEDARVAGPPNRGRGGGRGGQRAHFERDPRDAPSEEPQAVAAAAVPAISPTIERAIEATSLSEAAHQEQPERFHAAIIQRAGLAQRAMPTRREVSAQMSGPPQRALPVRRAVAAPIAATQPSVDTLVQWVCEHPAESIPLDILPADNQDLAAQLIGALAQLDIDDSVALANYCAAQSSRE